jgi:hypothetical protein
LAPSFGGQHHDHYGEREHQGHGVPHKSPGANEWFMFHLFLLWLHQHLLYLVL